MMASPLTTINIESVEQHGLKLDRLLLICKQVNGLQLKFSVAQLFGMSGKVVHWIHSN